MTLILGGEKYKPPSKESILFTIYYPNIPTPSITPTSSQSPLYWCAGQLTTHTQTDAFSVANSQNISFQCQFNHTVSQFIDHYIATKALQWLTVDKQLQYGTMQAVQRLSRMGWQRANVQDQAKGMAWLTQVIAIDGDTVYTFGDIHAEDKATSIKSWHVSAEFPIPPKPPYIMPPMDAVNFSFDLPFDTGPLVLQALVEQPPRPLETSLQSHLIVWGSNNHVDAESDVVWQTGVSPWRDPEWGKPEPPEPPEPPRPEPPQPDFDKPSVIMHQLQILSMPEGTPIHGSVSLSYDVDSYCWSATIAVEGKHQLPYLRATADGPRELKITVNGYVFNVFIEKITRRAQFPAESYSVTAYSYHRQFGAPWSPTFSGSVTADTSAHQLITSLLANTGFSLEVLNDAAWQTSPDFMIRAGTYSYVDKSPIEIISEILTSVGAILVPSTSERKWTLQPRYLLNPWHLADAPSNAFDHILPSNLNLDWEGQEVPAPNFDCVLISGINHGVSVNVKKKGASGATPAADVYHDLHQDQQQCIEHGRNVLCAAGNKELMTINLPLMPKGTAPEMVMPGKLAKYLHSSNAAANFNGVVLSIQISTNLGEIRQSVTIEVDNGSK